MIEHSLLFCVLTILFHMSSVCFFTLSVVFHCFSDIATIYAFKYLLSFITVDSQKMTPVIFSKHES